MGFYAGSYIQYANTLVLPMLKYVYWNNTNDTSFSTAFSDSGNAGAIVGMLFFGFMADRFGRRKMYKFELIILMAGTLGLIMSSAGYVPFKQSGQESSDSIDYGFFGSMDFYSWLTFWRFVTGIGFGGEYPLSAVIASEYAPTAKRPRILAIVFAMQAFGMATASIVSLIVTAAVHARYPNVAGDPVLSARAVDQIWRWVMGLGLIPAAFTAVLRFTIPESPRYTLDVLNDPLRASEETNKLKGWNQESELESSYDTMPLNDDRDPSSLSFDTKDHAFEYSENTQELTIKQYFWVQGNWRYLLGTALTWGLYNFASYALSFNETSTLSKFWDGNTSNTTSPIEYINLTDNAVHELVISYLPSSLGSLLLIFFITHIRRKLLSWTMYLAIGVLFIVMGVAMIETSNSQNFSISIGLFALIKALGTFGISPLNFLLPAELFPTKYRASCHAISASSGKVGSILASAFVGYVTFGSITSSSPSSEWQGYVFIISAIPLFLGAIASWLWIPELQEPSGANKTLEQLAKGREPSTMRRGFLSKLRA